MSLRATLAICLTLLGSVSAWADEPSYRAVVKVDSVYVRSGPGENYYPTESLRAGDKVRVLRQGPRGWVAISPTKESFNWISARYVQEVDDGMLEVTGDKVALRVGSDLTASREVWQQTLRRGDRVEMIDRVRASSGDWYRVSPPEGEVRWVFGKHLEPIGPAVERTAKPDPVTPPLAEPLSAPLLQPASHRSSPSSNYEARNQTLRQVVSPSRPTESVSRRLNEIEQQLRELDRREDALTGRYGQQTLPSPTTVQQGLAPEALPPGVPITGPIMAPASIAVTDPAWDPYCHDPATEIDCGVPLPPRWAGWGATGVKAGSDRIIGDADFFVPLWQDGYSLMFADFRGSSDDLDNQEVNGGVGLRSILGDDLILGGYGFFDYRWSHTGNEFMAITLGAELKTYRWDVRGNLYLAEDDTKAVGPAVPLTPNAVFANNTIVLVSGVAQQIERAYYGADFEVGALLAAWGPNNRFEVRAYGGGYYFDTDDARFPRIAGPRARIDLTAFDLPFLGNGSRLSVGAEYTWDDVRDSQVWGLARVQIPFNVFNSPAPQSPFRRRMLDPVQRDVDIVTQLADTPPRVENTMYHENGQPVGIVSLVDANTTDAPGAVSQAGAGSTVIVDGSKGVVQTSATAFMQEGQTVRGAGFVVRGTETGLTATFGSRPTINNSNSAVDTLVVANNTTVRDLDILGGRVGISSDPTGSVNDVDTFNDLTNVAIRGNSVSGAVVGLAFRDLNSGTVITDNNANGNSGVGIGMRSVGNNATVNSNTFSENGSAGVVVADAVDGVISNNTANDNGASGIVLNGNVNGVVSNNIANNNGAHGIASTGSVNGVVSNNTANDNGVHGIRVDNVNLGGVVSNNNAHRNGDAGFHVSGTMAGALTGNHASGNELGFVIVNDVAGNFSSNTASANAGHGFQFNDVLAGATFSNNTAIGNGFNADGDLLDATASGFVFNSNAGNFFGNTATNNASDGFAFDNNAITGQFAFNTALGNGVSATGTAGDATANGFAFNDNVGVFSFNTATENVNNGFSADDDGNFDNNLGAFFTNNTSNNNGDFGYRGVNNGTANNNNGAGNGGGGDTFP